MLAAAIILITLALVFYTAGVWAERYSGRLHWWHVALFAVGLTCDTSGTVAMTAIASLEGQGPVGILSAVMRLTGGIAIVLMAAHLGWAIVTMVRNREPELLTFHRFSVVVWAIWLVPYITGMLSAMLPR